MLNVLELLWTREQLLQNPSWVSLESVLPRLAEMALDMLMSGQSYSATLAYSRAFFDPPSIGDVLLTAGILQTDGERVAFLHPFFQAVLAAWQVQHSETSFHNYLSRPKFDANGLRIASKFDELLIALAGLLPTERDEAHPENFASLQAFSSSILDDIANVDPYLAAQAVDRGVPCQEALRYFIGLRLLQHELEKPSALGYETLSDLLEGDVGLFLQSLLRDGEPDLRFQVGDLLMAWGRYGAWRYLDELVTRLQQTERDVDAQIMSWRVQSVDALAILMSRLDSPSVQERVNVAWMLGELEDRAAVPALIRLLNDQDLQVRSQAAVSLGNLRDPLSLVPLFDALQTPDVALRRALAMALAAMGSVALPTLLTLLKQADATLRRIVAGVLGRIGDVSVVSDLIEGLNDPAPPVRAMCATALAQIRHPMVERIALRPLARLFSDTQPARWTQASVGEIALRAVEKIGTESAMYYVKLWRERQYKKDPLVQPRSTAEIAATRLAKDLKENQPAIESLSPESLDESFGETKPMPALSTPAPQAPDLPPELQSELRHESQLEIQAEGNPIPVPPSFAHPPLPFDELPLPSAPSAPSLSSSPSPESFNSVAEMVEALSSSDPRTHNRAARQLSDYAKLHQKTPNTEVEVLISGLSSSEWLVRWSVVEALAWWPHEHALPYLLTTLNDENWTVRLAVVRALIELRDLRALPSLVQHLRDLQEHPLVRETCAEALGVFQDQHAFEDLSAALSEAETDFVRLAILRALDKIADNRIPAVLDAFCRDYAAISTEDQVYQLAQSLLEKYRSSAET